jgi:hypothetical protein
MAAVLALWQLLAHQRAHRLIARDGTVRGFLVPRLWFAAVGEVAEPLIQRASPRIDLLHAEFGPVKTSGADALFGGADEDRADTARSQRRVDGQLPQRARVGVTA